MKNKKMKYLILTFLIILIHKVSFSQLIPKVNAGGDDVKIFIGGRMKIPATASGSNLSFKWTPSAGLDNDAILQPTVSVSGRTYSLTVTSKDGQIVRDDVYIGHHDLDIQNFFTPGLGQDGGDGVNDLWLIYGLDTYPGVEVRVYKLGNNDIVYSCIGYYRPWDGMQNDGNKPGGVYRYVIKTPGHPQGDEHLGYVTVIMNP